MTTLYDFSAVTLSGETLDLGRFRGKVVLVVNTASECGFTPQYAGLQELYAKYRKRGLEILGFPCNQFAGQEPGSAEQIGAFCRKNYGVDFRMFDKIEVNGPDAHPLWQWLTHAAPGLLGTEAVKWNFTKFLVGRDGAVVARYAPKVEPAALAPDIEAQLSKPSRGKP